MKFISRSSNYMLVLKPGIQGNHLTGQASVPGLYIRFRDGIVETRDEDIIKRIKDSEGFRNGDFIAVDDQGEDPFSSERIAAEPVHVVSEIKYGHVEGRKVSQVPPKVPAGLKKAIEAEARKMAKEMLPGLLKEAIKEMSVSAASAPSTPKAKASAPTIPTVTVEDDEESETV